MNRNTAHLRAAQACPIQAIELVRLIDNHKATHQSFCAANAQIERWAASTPRGVPRAVRVDIAWTNGMVFSQCLFLPSPSAAETFRLEREVERLVTAVAAFGCRDRLATTRRPHSDERAKRLAAALVKECLLDDTVAAFCRSLELSEPQGAEV